MSIAIVYDVSLAFAKRQSVDEEESVKIDINNMIDRFIAPQRTVILVVHAANVDYHNSLLPMALKFDGDGERTLCVVTKPDTVAEEDRRAMQLLVQNEARRLTLGYHCVRGRTTKELVDTVDVSLARERQYFETIGWSTQLSMSGLFGTPALVARLSQLLYERAAHELPKVKCDVAERLARCRAELVTLGGDLGQASVRRALFSDCVRDCAALLACAVDSCSYADAFFDVQARRVVAVQYQAEMAFSAALLALSHVPCQGEFRAGDRVLLASERGRSAPRVYVCGDTVECDGVPKVKLLKAGVGVAKAGIDDAELALAGPFRVEELVPEGRAALMRELAHCRGRELAGFLSFNVFAKLVTTRISNDWAPLARALLDAAGDGLRDMLTALTQRESVAAQLRARLRDAALGVAGGLLARAHEQLGVTLQNECNISTQNHYFTETVEKLRVQPLVARLKQQADSDGHVSVELAVAIVREAMAMSNEQNEAQEMEFRLHAYLRVAAKRFIDAAIGVVRTTLHGQLLRAVERAWSALASDDELERLFAETEARKAKRLQLIDMERRLSKAMQQLEH